MSSFERKSIWLYRLSSSLLLGITVLFPLKLLGAEQAVPQTEQAVPQTEQAAPQTEQAAPQTEQAVPQIEQAVPQTEQADRFDSMEAPRDYLSGKIASFARSIDRFFGGDRHYQESNESVVQLDLTRVAGYGGDRKFDLGARLNLRLPVTEGRLHLLLETDPENNITNQPIPGQAAPTQGQTAPTQGQTVLRNQVVAPGSYGLAARYETAVENVWHFSTDAGLKFPIPVQPFVRTRGSFSAPMGEWRLTATESVYWFNSIGAGETTELDLEHFLSEPVLFRATSIATWLNDKRNFDLRQDLSIYHTLSDRTALLYQASVTGVSNPAYAVTDYVVLLLYRYRLHREWLFFELSPQLHFPQVMKYQSSPALSMRLEVLFDESR
jgi:hypothetical protein